jgi:hypothetical protein
VGLQILKMLGRTFQGLLNIINEHGKPGTDGTLPNFPRKEKARAGKAELALTAVIHRFFWATFLVRSQDAQQKVRAH